MHQIELNQIQESMHLGVIDACKVDLQGPSKITIYSNLAYINYE